MPNFKLTEYADGEHWFRHPQPARESKEQVQLFLRYVAKTYSAIEEVYQMRSRYNSFVTDVARERGAGAGVEELLPALLPELRQQLQVLVIGMRAAVSELTLTYAATYMALRGEWPRNGPAVLSPEGQELRQSLELFLATKGRNVRNNLL
jgi:hypothetical protein